MGERQGVGRGRAAALLIGAALAVGAVVLIVVIAGHHGYPPLGAESNVVAVSLALALFGPNAIAGLFLAERRPRLAPLGYLVALVGALTLIAIVVHIVTGELYLGGDWHLEGVGVALTLASGQIALALAFGRDDEPALQLLAAATALTILVFGVFAAVEASGSGSSVSQKTLAVVAVLYLLGILLLTLFRGAARLDRRGRVGGSLALDHVVVAISDRSRSIPFYTALLGAEVVERPGGRIAFRVGGQLLNVHEPGVEAAPVASDPVRPGNSDLCFVWPAPPERAVELVRTLGAELVAGPVPREGAAGSGTSVYTRDPDGSLIELISYG